MVSGMFELAMVRPTLRTALWMARLSLLLIAAKYAMKAAVLTTAPMVWSSANFFAVLALCRDCDPSFCVTVPGKVSSRNCCQRMFGGHVRIVKKTN